MFTMTDLTKARDSGKTEVSWNVDESNVGLGLGKASGGLADVDLDCPEAVQLASRFLPPTRMRIARGGIETHRFFRVANDTGRRYDHKIALPTDPPPAPGPRSGVFHHRNVSSPPPGCLLVAGSFRQARSPNALLTRAP